MLLVVSSVYIDTVNRYRTFDSRESASRGRHKDSFVVHRLVDSKRELGLFLLQELFVFVEFIVVKVVEIVVAVLRKRIATRLAKVAKIQIIDPRRRQYGWCRDCWFWGRTRLVCPRA